MGYAFHDRCYETKVEAAKVDCFTSYPLVWGNGTALQGASCDGVTANGQLLVRLTTNGISNVTNYVTQTYSPCTWTDFPTNPAHLSPADGALVAAAVASVWMIAWGVRAAFSVVRDTTYSDE